MGELVSQGCVMRATAIGLVLLLGASAARAEDLAKARAYFQAGVDAYDEAKYEVALREFQHSHALSHNPELYFNMAACEEHMNHYQAASLLLRQYLIEKPAADDRPKIEARIKVLDEREESIHRMEPEPIVVHDRPALPPPPPPPPPKHSYVGGFVALGVTGALGIGAIASGAFALSEHGSLLNGCGKLPQGCTSAQTSAMDSAKVATDVLIGLTAAGAVVTIVLFVYESKHPVASRSALIPKAVGPMLGWSF
jgi:tetratricopeptide (TPR) repeat protein